MSIAFGGAMKDADDDALRQAMKAMRKIGQRRKRIVLIRQISLHCEPHLVLLRLRKRE